MSPRASTRASSSALVLSHPSSISTLRTVLSQDGVVGYAPGLLGGDARGQGCRAIVVVIGAAAAVSIDPSRRSPLGWRGGDEVPVECPVRELPRHEVLRTGK